MCSYYMKNVVQFVIHTEDYNTTAMRKIKDNAYGYCGGSNESLANENGQYTVHV